MWNALHFENRLGIPLIILNSAIIYLAAGSNSTGSWQMLAACLRWGGVIEIAN
jgi:hypothetical protein